MRFPHANTSGETLHGTYGLFHEARLRADPQCADLATAFSAAQGQLKTRLDQHQVAQANAMTALAARDAQVADLDRQVRAFSLAVLARVNNSRRAPLYQTYFPVGTRPVIYAPVEVELTHVGAILAKLAEEADPTLRTFLTPLQLAAGSTRAAIDARHAASDAEANAFGLLRAESIQWMAAYRRSYRDLQRMFYQDLDRAESFFRSSGVTWGGARSEEAADRAAASIVPLERSTIRPSAPGAEIGNGD